MPQDMPAERPDTYAVNVDQALETLDHAEMIVLSEMFERWALTDPKIDPEYRTQLILWAVDYERVAEFCGPGWKASDPDEPPSLIPYVARMEMRVRGLGQPSLLTQRGARPKASGG